MLKHLKLKQYTNLYKYLVVDLVHFTILPLCVERLNIIILIVQDTTYYEYKIIN